VIVPAVFNVIADVVLFVYPFPIIFMANIPKSLRYSLLFVFATCGIVPASAIVRVAIMTSENFLQRQNVEQYVPVPWSPVNRRLTYWGAIEGAVSLLVASAPVIGGRMIARWRHILARSTNVQSMNLSRSLRSKCRSGHQSTQVLPSLRDGSLADVASEGGEKTIETFISTGSSTLAEGEYHEEEPSSLIHHMARMGQAGGRHEQSPAASDSNSTIKKGEYLGDGHAANGADDNV
jgi:hypothetical protein